jgi:hypothetical protein
MQAKAAKRNHWLKAESGCLDSKRPSELGSEPILERLAEREASNNWWRHSDWVRAQTDDRRPVN